MRTTHCIAIWSALRFLPVAVCLCCCVGGVRVAVGQEVTGRVVNRVVAKVNRDVIMQSDIERFKRRWKRSMGNDAVPETSAVLESLFDAQLLRQMAADRGYKPSDSEISTRVEGQIAEFRKVFITTEQFTAAMKKTGYTEELLREDLRNEARAEMQIQYAINMRFQLSDAEVQNFTDQQKKSGKAVEELHVCRLGVSFGEAIEVTQKEATDKLNAILAKIKNDGLDFTDGVRKHVTIEQVQTGTIRADDYGPLMTDKLAAQVVAACKEAPPHSWTAAIQTGDAVSAFYIVSRRNARSLLYEQKFGNARQNLLRELRRKARILIYPAEYKTQIPQTYKDTIGNSDE